MPPPPLRPCLKIDHPSAAANSPSPFPFAACSNVLSPRVHFPPTPALTSTHLTHSSKHYDRAPIVVAPNACALPERNGRTYSPPSEPMRPSKTKAPPYAQAQAQAHAVKGSYFHPRAFEACEREPSTVPVPPFDPPPPLVPDISSSESDESDTYLTTPPDPHHYPHMPFQLPSNHHAHAPMAYPRDDKGAAMLFLPHPPSPKQERQRERERARSPSRTRGHRQTKRSEFAAPELDGCLGGF
ncbi:hypothetical protein HETIRDRAFT_456613 [Heterobasidion irregulare TC 32-1]|uniref:Uncharacterized protein n=1 Tax=Heterobasidion irregulare (strain TC 32-1) TaxID=747525 RepID=W4KLG2_HETIT|nr:uncharacterized protein HETIRDRAFT_456613 [Heterobasidion irregulare TC 32-1]ETW86667.1 hypothetical protein HETIRDRAFT_456613 [Heterobasidion irregulare TC 32-1]